MNRTRPTLLLALAAALSLVAVACGSAPSVAAPAAPESVTVQPDLSYPPYLVNVYLTDTGFEPEILLLPAGRPVTLILRDHGTGEHHYRVEGLIPAQLQWLMIPEITEYDLQNLSPADLAARGIDLENPSDVEHQLHHLVPTWVPVRDRSPAGIKPLGTEVHGWVTIGSTDTISFIPLNTGTFVAENVLHPEITGKVIVFLPPGE
jgi:hypothetical protein